MASDTEAALDLTERFPLAEEVGRALIGAGLTVATAESCTGGLVAAALAAAPEATRFLRGGVVAYSPDVKTSELGVSSELLDLDGAVSDEVAQAMARGVRERLGADVGLAVTGLVGEGDEGKPAGLTFVGIASGRGVQVRRLDGDDGPPANCERAVRTALELCLDTVGGGTRR